MVGKINRTPFLQLVQESQILREFQSFLQQILIRWDIRALIITGDIQSVYLPLRVFFAPLAPKITSEISYIFAIALSAK